MRVSWLADDVPQVAEPDLNPVIARPDGARGRRAGTHPARRADRPLTAQAAVISGPSPAHGPKTWSAMAYAPLPAGAGWPPGSRQDTSRG